MAKWHPAANNGMAEIKRAFGATNHNIEGQISRSEISANAHSDEESHFLFGSKHICTSQTGEWIVQMPCGH